MTIGVALLLGGERVLRKEQSDFLSRSGIEIAYAGATTEAVRLLEQRRFNVVLTCVPVLDVLGAELVEALKRIDSELPVILFEEVECQHARGPIPEEQVFDYVLKKVDGKSLFRRVRQAVRQHKLVAENHLLTRRLEEGRSFMVARTEPQGDPLVWRQDPTGVLIGRSKAMERVRQEVTEAAETDITVLIHGETGTGKDVAAHAVHEAGRANREGPFVKISCPALPEHLLESELFGHEEGAFTGSVKRKPGRLELARSGTAFFDEITEMSSAVQAKLLEVLEHKTFTRVGGVEPVHVDTRMVAATNVDLEDLLGKGRFRPDLYYRLNQYTIHMPPLRERVEDIPVLVDYFLKKYERRYGGETRTVPPSCMSKLVSYPWPGNVRELESAAKRFALSGNEEVLCFSFPKASTKPIWTAGLGTYQENEKRVILSALSETRWNRREAAKMLGISYNTLRRRIQRYQFKTVPHL